MTTHLARPTLTLPGPFSAVVSDMDGLLVQTERQWLQAKLVLFGRYGAELREEDLAAVFGASERESARYFAGRFGLSPADIASLRDEYLAIVSDLFDAGVELAPGALELMERLSGRVPLAVASNSRRSLMRAALRPFPPSVRFDVIVSGEEARPKPAPDLYLLACARLGVDPSVAVALEDSPTGVTAARSAGLTCIGVPSDPRHRLEQADVVVGTLLELLEDPG
jgi:HAD superfamily hydrolase (TIGR01509 family)